jgi:hypothetical protein
MHGNPLLIAESSGEKPFVQPELLWLQYIANCVGAIETTHTVTTICHYHIWEASSTTKPEQSDQKYITQQHL